MLFASTKKPSNEEHDFTIIFVLLLFVVGLDNRVIKLYQNMSHLLLLYKLMEKKCFESSACVMCTMSFTKNFLVSLPNCVSMAHR